MRWHNKLTKKEKLHLREVAKCFTLKQVKHTFAEQVEMRRLTPGFEPCFECKAIARKLGLPV